MFWFYTQCLLPVLRVLYVLLDWVLGWTTLLGPLAALIIAGAVTGLAVNLFQKYLGNQKLLGLCKADLKRLKELLQTARSTGDKESAARLASLAGKISGRYAWGSCKPALWSVLPLCVLATWTASRLSFEPVRPGDEIKVVADFEDGAGGFAHIIPNQGLIPAGAAIVPVTVPQAQPNAGPAEKASQSPNSRGPQAEWLIKAACAGDFTLTVRYNGNTYALPLQIRARGGRAPESPVVFNPETPTHDNLQGVSLLLKDSVPAAWWNARQKWLGLYLAVALIFGFGLRPLMRIQ
ncbi:MAG: hypothetical protein ABSE73_03445 [Planctomycetota bacterium]